MPKKHKRVTIRGVEYPSHKDAAEALGVSRQRITQCVQKGYFDGVGLGNSAPLVTRNVRRVIIEGVEYASAKDAAKALGVGLTSVYKRGDFQGEAPRGKRVTIEGVTYSSKSDAMRATGRTLYTINKYLDTGFFPGENPRTRITIDGVAYNSQIDAAKALGLSRADIKMILDNS